MDCTVIPIYYNTYPRKLEVDFDTFTKTFKFFGYFTITPNESEILPVLSRILFPLRFKMNGCKFPPDSRIFPVFSPNYKFFVTLQMKFSPKHPA